MSEITGQGVDAAGIVFVDRRAARDDVESRPFLTPLLGHEKRSVFEVERSEAATLRDAHTRLAPAQTPRNHEVQDEEELVLELDHDPLADPLDPTDLLFDRLFRGWLHGPQPERTPKAETRQALANHLPPQRGQIRLDIW